MARSRHAHLTPAERWERRAGRRPRPTERRTSTRPQVARLALAGAL